MSEGIELSIVVPVMDEAKSVAALAREIDAAMADAAHEVIFVDDGSSDGTAEALLAARAELPQLRVLIHGQNLGKSQAIRTGVRAARGGIIVTIDGDGQNDPADIARMVAGFSGQPRLGLVAGQRIKREDNWRKRAASRFANAIRRWCLGDTARDVGCGFKAFRRDAFLTLPYFDTMHRFLITLMLREGYEVQYVDVRDRPRRHGRSKYGVWDRLSVGVPDLLGVMWLRRRFKGVAEPREL